MKIGILERKHAYLGIERIIAELGYANLFDYCQYESYPDIVEKYNIHKTEWDGLLFSGPVGYNYFIDNTEKVYIPVMYIENNFEAYYAALLSHMAGSSIPLSEVYIDTQNDYNFISPLQRILPQEKMPKILSGYDDFRDDLQEYVFSKVKEMWENGEIKLAYIALPETYRLLSEAGAPCKWVEFKRENVVRGLEAIKRQAALNDESRNSTVVLVIDFIPRERKTISPDETEFRRATLYKALVDFKRKYLTDVDVNIVEGVSSFEMSFSRKELDLLDEEKVPFNSFLNEYYRMDYVMGMGAGSDISEARINSESALDFARDFGGKCCFIVERGTVTGPINTDACLEFSLKTYYENAKRARSSVTTNENFTRCEALIDAHPEGITGAQLARFLNVSERSANRIITQLLEAGALEIQDVVNYNVGQGRPTRRYRKKSGGSKI